jgi:hypothetical protein
MSGQFATSSAQIAAAVRDGCSIEDAARMAGVAVATARRWLRDGRKGREPYAGFATAVDGARDERQRAERALREGPLTPQEAERLLAKAARKGSVPALRLWYEQRAGDAAGRRGAEARKILEGVFSAN